MAASWWDGGRASFERWDGRQWTTLQSDIPSTYGDHWGEIEGVSCVSTQFCVAVGTAAQVTQCDNWFICGVGLYAPLVMLWNGSTWSAQPTPALTATGALAHLDAVSCASSTWCVAVGYRTVAQTEIAYSAVWQGQSWTELPAPVDVNTEQVWAVMASVSCPVVNWCTAVGGAEDENGHGSTAIWQLSSPPGVLTWHRLSSPNPNTPSYALQGVSCVSVTSCVAVGIAGNSSAELYSYGPLIEVLGSASGGDAWSIVQNPPGGALMSVSCVTATACTAVGSQTLESLTTSTGSAPTWTAVTGPTRTTAVSCVPSGTRPFCMAVS